MFNYLENNFFKGYRLVAIDRGGTGYSDDIPSTHKLSLRNAANCAEELHRVLNHELFRCHIYNDNKNKNKHQEEEDSSTSGNSNNNSKNNNDNNKFILAGGSFGGLVAMYYYYKYPEHVRALFFQDPNTFETMKISPISMRIGFAVAPTVYAFVAVLSYTGFTRILMETMVALMPNSEALNVFSANEQSILYLQYLVSVRNMWSMSTEFGGYSAACDNVAEIMSTTPDTTIKVPIYVMTSMNWDAYDSNFGPTWRDSQYRNLINHGDANVKCVQVVMESNNHQQVCLGEPELVGELMAEIVKETTSTGTTASAN